MLGPLGAPRRFSHQKESTKCASAVARGETGEVEPDLADAVAVTLAVGGACVAVAAAAQAIKPNIMQNYTLDAADPSSSGLGDGGGAPVEERIAEFERKVPFKGFKPSHLFPNEPNFRRGDGSGLALLSKEDLLLPAGWSWLDDDWSVLTGPSSNAAGTDQDGWMYAFNWAGDDGYAASGGMTDCVRKRIWIRRRAASTTPAERTAEEDCVSDDVKDLFEKHGLSVDICVRVCEELGSNVVADLKLVQQGDVDALTWLKPIQKRKLLNLISDTQV